MSHPGEIFDEGLVTIQQNKNQSPTQRWSVPQLPCEGEVMHGDGLGVVA
jgi:hypothetical protein